MLSTFLLAISMAAVRSAPRIDSGACTAICVAVSDDGLQFKATGEVFVRGGSCPALVRLANGELLAIFRYGPDKPGEAAAGRLYASRSKDNGKSWASPRTIRIEELPENIEVHGPTLLVMPSGLVRMYFAAGERPDQSPRRREATILSAVTRNGVDYKLDRGVCVPIRFPGPARLSVYSASERIILLIEALSRAARVGMVQQLSSRDGRSFSRIDRGRQPGPVGPVLQVTPRFWRMFIASGGSVYSRGSNDGLRWRSESDPRLKDAIGTAVARTSSKHCLMLFTRVVRPSDATVRPLAAIAPNNRSPDKDQPALATDDQGLGSGATPRNNKSEKKTTATAGNGFDDFTSADFSAELGENAMAAGDAADPVVADDEGFAPIPDLRHPVDYVAWFEQQATLPPEQNVYRSYEAVRQAMVALPDDAFKDRYNSGESSGPPTPWDPAAHPVWESCYQAQQDVLATLRWAAHDNRPYALEPTWGEGTAPEDRTLWGIHLPGLAQLRGANKANLSQAWRMEGGIVPPEQMREAISTGVGLASHLQQAPTLIEQLVGCANRNMTLENARWALQEGVFDSAEDIESTLTVLRERDLPDGDPGSWIRFEHAAAMDMVQYVFEPVEPGGEPVFREDRLEAMLSTAVGDESPSVQDGLLAVQACDAYWREVKVNLEASWPYSMSQISEQLVQRYMGENKLAAMLIPSVDRACEHLRRAEASRRATQLAYSIELYRARNGRYPTSLNELPYAQVYDVRSDPFSGADFAYRLTDSGPLLYSVSDNGLDDGGVHSRKWGDRDGNPALDDFVFWPAQE